MRTRFCLVVVVALAWASVGGAAAAGPDDLVVFDADRARVHAGTPAAPLLAAGAAGAGSDEALVRAFLGSTGASRPTLDSLVADSAFTAHGVTHLRFSQRVGGLRVAGAYVRAALDGDGDLVHVIDNTVAIEGTPADTDVGPERALDAAMRHVHPGVGERPAVAARRGPATAFARTPFFAQGPRVERVVVARRSGALEIGHLVETWSREENLLHESLVDRRGAVVRVELRTADDSYKVYRIDPEKGAQEVAQGPGAGNTESPIGWLTGSQLTTNINGNNVQSYLDVDANNAPDAGGTAVTDGNFWATSDLTQTPATTANRAVAVQNLFYLNNVVHDTLYRHGFTEAAGNFQADNFGKGGLGGDPVNAEVQDGSGTNNANFATPADGSRPRMQMYLWDGAGPTHEVAVGTSTYGARDAYFGPSLTATGVTGKLVLANDRVGVSSDACEALPKNSMRKAIALIDRGSCAFVVKVKNAQNAGALGVVVANHIDGEEPFRMGGSDSTIRISSLMVSKSDGTALKSRLGQSATIRLKSPGPLQRDSSLDSDIVLHEYGHGLTWRMIGGMSGKLAGAVGEGASDGLAMLINGDDRIGEYSASKSTGIRSAPYDAMTKTYSDVTGGGVHADGEVYAAIVWDLRAEYAAAGLTVPALFTTWVDGMNYTAATPAYEDMRDGMLSSAAARGRAAERCPIWRAFAGGGVGVGADGSVSSGGTVTIVESFTKPEGC